MKLEDISHIHIIPSLKCNLECFHCATSSGPNNETRLTTTEELFLSDTLNTVRPREVSFSGGEPLLRENISIISDLITRYQFRDLSKISFTTNGLLFIDDQSVDRILSKLIKIDKINLSIDKWHHPKPELRKLVAIQKACTKRNIQFSIIFCFSSPLDLTDTEQIKDALPNTDISLSKICSSGRAKENGLCFQYPLFQSEVLDKKCPLGNSIVYFPGKRYN